MWKYFTRDEFKCSHCGENRIEDDFITRLDAFRESAGFPFGINSGFRCRYHPVERRKTLPDGPHTTGWASDIRTYNSHQRFILIDLAIRNGVVRFGIGEDFFHIDWCNELDPERYPPEVVWDYY